MSNRRVDPKETAERFLNYLRQFRNDRGAMADLRRALTPAQRPRAWPFLAKFGGIGEPRFETVAGLFARHPMETPLGNLGGTCRQLSGEYKSFDGRFRRLLRCDRDSICQHVRPIVFTAAAKSIPVNYEQLFLDLWYWSDRVKERWAAEFWAAAGDEETSTSLEATP